MVLNIRIAKFKFHQYQLRAILPNFNSHQSYLHRFAMYKVGDQATYL